MEDLSTWEERDGVLYKVLQDEHGSPLTDTWDGAKERCENENAIVFTQKKNMIRTWIGANNQSMEGNWLWSDLSVVDRSDWSPGSYFFIYLYFFETLRRIFIGKR